MLDLSKVSIMVRTFLRDECLFNTVSAIEHTMPEIRIIIVDDGEMTEEKDGVYADLIRRGHQIIVLDFDKGFGAKSNAGVAALQTPYILIGSDDFDFSPASVRWGIEQLVRVLDDEPYLYIASGRVEGRGGAYEFHLHDEGHKITETPIDYCPEEHADFVPCDLTHNYSLIRKEVFDRIRWDEENKIGGGEHGAFFVDCKRAGFRTAWVPGVSIAEQKIPASPRYKQYRARGYGRERISFEKRGITEYILGNGVVDYKK